MKVYKLTDQDDRTFCGTQWGEGVTHEAPGTGGLCTAGWIHCYTDPLLAAMLNPIHMNFTSPHLWEAEADGEMRDDGLKCGVQRLTTLRQLQPPELTIAQRVRFGILCAREECRNEAWRSWADKWLSGADRSQEAAAWAAALAVEGAKTNFDLVKLAEEAVRQ